MSIQKLINSAQKITIDRQPIVAMTMSRGQYIKTAERGARIWKFIVTPSAGWRWEEYRDEIEDLDAMNRITEEEINIGSNNTGLSWMTAYRGACNTSQLNGLSIASVVGDTITLNNSIGILATTIVFKKGDYIQPFSSSYPYTITADVLMPESGVITVPVNRGVLGTVTGQTLKIGSNVTWRVKIVKFPNYSVTPGRLVAWEGEFELVEVLQ